MGKFDFEIIENFGLVRLWDKSGNSAPAGTKRAAEDPGRLPVMADAGTGHVICLGRIATNQQNARETHGKRTQFTHGAV